MRVDGYWYGRDEEILELDHPKSVLRLLGVLGILLGLEGGDHRLDLVVRKHHEVLPLAEHRHLDVLAARLDHLEQRAAGMGAASESEMGAVGAVGGGANSTTGFVINLRCSDGDLAVPMTLGCSSPSASLDLGMLRLR